MLGDVLPAEAFGFLLVATRLVALIIVMPVLGDTSIPGRIRAGMGFLFSLVIYASVRSDLPPMPDNAFIVGSLLIREFVIGVIMGLATRILLTATHTAGTVIAFQTGLAAAQSFDPAQGSQSALVASFLTLVAITLIVVTDLHHLMILGMANSFVKFPVGLGLPYTDFATVITHYVSGAFLLGVHLAAPFIAYAVIYNLGLGLISRLIPGFQVFFIGMPINLFMGFTLTMILIGSIMQLFLERFEELLVSFLG
ncbi:MAG: flagellar biosynthetic protein FliR [Alphaproteobacteria bacterium]|nr:flagellar biosynthetic protein FliR [Alphaproteobacteria bacterium]